MTMTMTNTITATCNVPEVLAEHQAREGRTVEQRRGGGPWVESLFDTPGGFINGIATGREFRLLLGDDPDAAARLLAEWGQRDGVEVRHPNGLVSALNVPVMAHNLRRRPDHYSIHAVVPVSVSVEMSPADARHIADGGDPSPEVREACDAAAPPETVTVVLRRDDAEWIAATPAGTDQHARITAACRTALGES